MPPSITPFHSVRTLAFRPRATSASASAFRHANPVSGVKRRAFADEAPFEKQNALSEAEKGEVGPNMQQAEHVSEEAAKMSQIMGTGEGPDMEQGTPVQDVRYILLSTSQLMETETLMETIDGY